MSNKINNHEIPVIFECQGEQLIGMIHTSDAVTSIGILIIVGGSQYRVGSHRQFVLLARHLATENIPTMRFDVRGMGDSEGQPRSFQQIDDDIKAAIDCFFKICPTLNHVVLWGLCDAASAILFYGYQDTRVKGLVLLNPWIFTEKGSAKTYFKYYYLHRLLSTHLWQKIFCLKFNYLHSLKALALFVKKFFFSKTSDSFDSLNLPIRMRECASKFKFPILLILSGNDLTANEFKDVVKSDVEWQKLLKNDRISRYDFIEADHTFASSKWRNQVAILTADWFKILTLNIIKD